MKQYVYVYRKPEFDDESRALSQTLVSELNIKAKVQCVRGYMVEGISDDEFALAIQRVFCEPMVELATTEHPITKTTHFTKQLLPGQFDQKAQSAQMCLQLISDSSSITVTPVDRVEFDRSLSEEEAARFLDYWINPIESRLYQSSVMVEPALQSHQVHVIDGFCDMTEPMLADFLNQRQMAMKLDDLKLIQHYFQQEKRQPSETELLVLDTYWSDHCRHTTFNTHLSSVELTSGPLQKVIQENFELYRSMRKQANRLHKSYSLMDMATISAKIYADPRIEISDEVNACSFESDVIVDGVRERWLIQFKNETHNHPTEIEPFGGASTCIGGCIRDPLSGRAYVYQALRISGCGDVHQSIQETLKDKLPQKMIAKRATEGNSSYGNQIGVATTYISELYHPSYQAKHFELGAVVGAVKKENIQRSSPVAGDVIVVLGGKTGRDGIGGATGSSKAHTSDSLVECAAQVQKGNAPEQRQIQRLFLLPEVSRMIKKSNDFGAGGVSVAIGELADGLDIDLSALPLKYDGLTPSEIAISESQERMAVVLDPKDVQRFLTLAQSEQIEATVVAKVTDTHRLIMHYEGKEYVNLDRDFIDSAGATYKQAVICNSTVNTRKEGTKELHEAAICDHVSSLNQALNPGLIEHFDASIGATTLLFPLGGKTLSTPTLASVQRVYVKDQRSSTATILASGFIPELSEEHAFISGQGSVLVSIAKAMAVGGRIRDMFFSFQEYFPALRDDPIKWGNVVSTMLGANSILHAFSRPAIGGKDSMSGSFKTLDVLDTFVSFACCTTDENRVKSNELKEAGNYLYLIKTERTLNGDFDLTETVQRFEWVEQIMYNQAIVSVGVVERSLLTTLISMAAGNRLGISIDTTLDLYRSYPASFIIESTKPLDSPYAILLGQVEEKNMIICGVEVSGERVFDAYTQGMKFLYPKHKEKQLEIYDYLGVDKKPVNYPLAAKKDVCVVIPVFYGTNCESDTALAFKEANAQVVTVNIAHQSSTKLEESLIHFANTIDQSDILVFPGGFSMGDQPDGSAKFIVNTIKHPRVKQAIERLLQRKGLILGICNGFQALIKSGLLPYGEIRDLDSHDATLTFNSIGRHISTMAHTVVTTNWSPWLSGCELRSVSSVALSHGEGRLVVSDEQLKTWKQQGLIALQYCDAFGKVSSQAEVNVNGSQFAIEGLVSPCGQILGKMGHVERMVGGLYRNLPIQKQVSIIENGVNYFRKRGLDHGKES